MPRKIKVAEVVSRLESGGVESMLLNYLGHFKHPEDFDIHILLILSPISARAS